MALTPEQIEELNKEKQLVIQEDNNKNWKFPTIHKANLQTKWMLQWLGC